QAARARDAQRVVALRRGAVDAARVEQVQPAVMGDDLRRLDDRRLPAPGAAQQLAPRTDQPQPAAPQAPDPDPARAPDRVAVLLPDEVRAPQGVAHLGRVDRAGALAAERAAVAVAPGRRRRGGGGAAPRAAPAPRAV